MNAIHMFWRDRDFEDLKQESYISLMGMPDTWTEAKVVVMIRFRAIDWLRKRDGKKRNRSLRDQLVLGGVDIPHDGDVFLMPSVLFGLSGREGVVADLWYKGWLQDDIGKEVGVSESRVSQLLAKIRKDIRRNDEAKVD